MTYHGFDLLEERDIPEINTHARLFRHAQTGARLLSLENDDENKVFGITFRTPPTDSTGVAHIMEHSVLCGSRKYPVKEPFIELVKGSLKTFLNAFTFPDKTCYPVASQNLKDFYNLIDVYLDAVFYPLIAPETLQQEGWHYELEQVDAPLSYKGVVFNEMKGVFSSPEGVLGRYTQQSLFPENAYGVESGGDPRHIPDLTYAQFKAFHEQYYHPSNAYIFFCGDDPADERLRLMNEWLQEFPALQVNSKIAIQPRWQQPKAMTIPYDAGQEPQGNKGMVTVNWLLPETLDAQAVLAFHILDHILIGTPASPLRKALIDSGLGEDLAGGGLEADLRQMYYSTGMKGIAVENAGKVEGLIVDTLTSLANSGIDPEMVEAAVNTLEFRLRENNSGSYPRGLLLMLQALTTWLHDGDPLAPLAFEQPLAAIKAALAEGKYFEGLITNHFLANPHRTTVLLKPDSELHQKEEAAEQERLSQARAVMDAQKLQAVVENTGKLKLRQETPDSPEALALLPGLKLSDLDQQNKLIPLASSDFAGCTILNHNLFTNGILYLDLGFNLHVLPQDLLPFITLFGRALLETGTEKEDFVKLSQHIGRTTGGIEPDSLTTSVRLRQAGAAWLFLRGKAVASRVEEMCAILRDILLTARLDNQERFRQIVLEEKANQEAMLTPMGHSVVNMRLRAQFDEADWAGEQIHGLSYLFFLRQLIDAIDRDWPGVLEKLETIRKMLINRRNALLNITIDQGNWKILQPQVEGFLNALPAFAPNVQAWTLASKDGAEGLTIPAQVNYVGKGANIYRLGYEFNGSLMVILNCLRATWLWERVRVKGGAYGGFCQFDHRSGVFTYLSYRDPNLLLTLENYDQTAQFLRQLNLSQEELVKNIIGAISDLDRYMLPDAKGYVSMVRHLAGDTDDFRQKLRDQVLSTTQADFRAFADVLEKVNTAGQVVVLGSQEAVQAANAQRNGWLEIKKVL